MKVFTLFSQVYYLKVFLNPRTIGRLFGFTSIMHFLFLWKQLAILEHPSASLPVFIRPWTSHMKYSVIFMHCFSFHHNKSDLSLLSPISSFISELHAGDFLFLALLQ